MELKKTAFGLATGLVWGGGLFVATLWVMMFGGGGHLQLLGRFYLGYHVSVLGAFVGLAYGFVDGFIGGFLVAWLYNCFAAAKPATVAGAESGAAT